MKKKLVILSSICVILLLALVGGTLAWFYVNEEVSVMYGNSVFCEAGDSLEIALVNNGSASKWSSTIDYSAGEFTVIDISGDGKDLYRPSVIDEYQQPKEFILAKSSLKDSKDYDYIEMELAFRSVSKMNVYLSEESFIAPVNTKDDGSNIYGDFSRDYVAGAMRVAILDETGSEVKLLWAPNSKYELIKDDKNGIYAFNSGENGNSNPETDYFFYGDKNGEIIQQPIPADSYAKKQFVVDSTGATLDYTGNSPVIVSLDPRNGTTDQKTVKIRIWFEGTDREAHQALAGGNINVKLKFVGVYKETDTEKQAAIDNVALDQDSSKISGVLEGMLFSTDGQTWTEYKTGVVLPTLESGSSIYIKYPETETHFETSCKKLTKN